MFYFFENSQFRRYAPDTYEQRRVSPMDQPKRKPLTDDHKRNIVYKYVDDE